MRITMMSNKKNKNPYNIPGYEDMKEVESLEEFFTETRPKEIPEHLAVYPAYNESKFQAKELRYYKSYTNPYNSIAYFIDNEKGEPEYNPNRAGAIACSSDPYSAIHQVYSLMNRYPNKIKPNTRYMYQFIVWCKLFNKVSLNDIHTIIQKALGIFRGEYMIYYYIHGRRNEHDVHVHISIFPININTGRRLHFTDSQFYHLEDKMNLSVDRIIMAMKRDIRYAQKKSR